MNGRPLGKRALQHQLALGLDDEVVAQPVEPEAGPVRLGDAGVERGNARRPPVAFHRKVRDMSRA